MLNVKGGRGCCEVGPWQPPLLLQIAPTLTIELLMVMKLIVNINDKDSWPSIAA